MNRKDERDDLPRPLGERIRRALFRDPAVVLLERGPDPLARYAAERPRDYAG